MEVNADGRADAATSRTSSSGRSSRSPSRRGSTSRSTVAPDVPPPIYTDGQRLQQVLKNLLSNAFKFTEQGGVTLIDPHGGQGPALRERAALDRADDGDRVRGDRHRHRHPAGQAAADLRGVPAGRRHDEPQVRRHRSRPVDQPRDRAPARRRDSRREHAGPGQHVHALPAGAATSSPSARGDGDGGDAPRRARRRVARVPSGARRPRGSVARRRARAAHAQRRRRRVARAQRHRGERGVDAVDGGDADGDRPERRTTSPMSTRCAAAAGRLRRRSRRHRAGRPRRCSSSRTTRTSRRSCSRWRARRASRASSRSTARPGCSWRTRIEPDAITLDIDMPGIDGWAVLDRLKHHPETRHIPVHIITGIRERQQGLQGGRDRVSREAGHEGGARRFVQQDLAVHRSAGEAAARRRGRRRRSGRA